MNTKANSFHKSFSMYGDKPQPVRSAGNSNRSKREQKEFQMSMRISQDRLVVAGAAALLSIGFGVLGMTRSVCAGVIVSDTFTAANGTGINGRTPAPVDLPNATWVEANGSWENDIQNNLATLGADEGDAISIGTVASAYAVTSYTISDSFNLGTDSMGTYPLRGTWLGFFGSGTSQENTFTGLIVNPNGNMWLINNSNTVGSAVAISGFNAAVTHTLSYSVNTTTGTASDILLDGNLISLSVPSGTFTQADTAYAGFHNMSNSGSSIGTVGNFVLSSPSVPVPEPAALGLFAVGGLGLLMLKRRKTV